MASDGGAIVECADCTIYWNWMSDVHCADPFVFLNGVSLCHDVGGSRAVYIYRDKEKERCYPLLYRLMARSIMSL